VTVSCADSDLLPAANTDNHPSPPAASSSSSSVQSQSPQLSDGEAGETVKTAPSVHRRSQRHKK